jgi:hypothetical protein
MDTVEFEHFTKQLIDTLSADPDVLGLIGVGSTADASYRDTWSDHDFWLIVSLAAVPRYRAGVTWLPQSTEILISVQHGAAGRSVLYRSRHCVEYLVFAPTDVPSGKLERHSILIDRANIAPLASQVQSETLAPARGRPEPLQNLGLLVWSGQQRLRRGELLSAHRYLTGFAVDNLLELFRRHGLLGEHPTADRLDPRRRLEQLAPPVAKELQRILSLPLSQVGAALLHMAEGHVRPVAPDLNWPAIAEVCRWLADAAV